MLELFALLKEKNNILKIVEKLNGLSISSGKEFRKQFTKIIMYDIIGDVHGQATLLKKLLLKLGYQKGETGYFHSERKAVFVGDFINRGDEIRKTIKLIRKMVRNGNAFAILGNHEINAILFDMKDVDGKPLIKQPRKSYLSLFKTINEYVDRTEQWEKHIRWIRSLPLFIEFDNIRFVHACWSDLAVEQLKIKLAEESNTKNIYREYYKSPKSELSKSISILTKGIDLKMPGDLKIVNNKGVIPLSFRLSWWKKPEGKTFREMSFESKFKLPAYTIPPEILPETFFYSENESPVFFGHYCRGRGPHIIKSNICCVDSCVSRTKVLTAYSWSGEKVLVKENLVHVNRVS
jgi:hypothetical protein